MRLLFIGGTRFVGRAIVEAAVTAGHDVTVLHRGQTVAEGLEGVRHLTADRNADLSVLRGETFDATVDVCAYWPRQVVDLATALGGSGGHHVLISTVSVYADSDGPGITEDSPLAELSDPTTETVTNETYGGLKVLCERAALDAYGADHLTIVRPTYVVGPHDYTFRFPWWVSRIARGGEVLAPGPETAPVQLVDARDQGSWTISLTERRTAGVFNGIGTSPPFGFADMLGAIADAVAPAGTTLTWVDGGWLTERGVSGVDLPLWSEGVDEWVVAASNDRALASGLTPRPLADTIRDTLDWLRRDDARPPRGSGLDAGREQALLADWHARG
jgi:2'-hydroxyisoflavone reductase